MTTFNKSIIAVNPSPTGITVTLESTYTILGILVSGSILITVVIKLISNFNHLSERVISLKAELEKHTASEGHERLIERVNQLREIDKKLDIHIQDYVNRKDTVQMLIGQLNEKIDHKFRRLHGSMKDIERYLQRGDTSYRMKEYGEEREE